MPKYRQVDLRLWNDRRFLSLSERGKVLWMFFLTAPCSLPIPGVIIAGEASLAEHLGWSVTIYRRTLAELIEKEMKVKVEGKVIWLWNSLAYNPPKGPSMLAGWAKCWDDIPMSALKSQIWDALRTASSAWSDTFFESFSNPTSNIVGQLALGIPPHHPPPQPPPTKIPGSGSGSGSVAGSGSLASLGRTRARDPAAGTPEPVAIVPLADPEAENRQQRVTALVRHGFRRQLEAYNRIRSENGLQVPPLAAVGDPAERALLELVKSWPSLDGAQERIDHVLDVRIREAEESRYVGYLGVTLWRQGNFERALSLVAGQGPPRKEAMSIERAFEALDRARAEEEKRARDDDDDDESEHGHLVVFNGGYS